jgi:hypothetical protein
VFRLKNEWELYEHICVSEANGNPEYLEYKEWAWQLSEQSNNSRGAAGAVNQVDMVIPGNECHMVISATGLRFEVCG